MTSQAGGLIDAGMAARFAARLASVAPLDRSYLLDGVQESLEKLVVEALPLVEEETGFVTPGDCLPRVVTRAEWASANVEGLMTLMKPLLERVDRRMGDGALGPALKSTYRQALGAQLGMVLGFISRRVLGQYDVLAPSGDEVLFVGSNLVEMEHRHGFVPRDFRMWVVLHELTHRAQFESNRWLRTHFLESVGEFISSMQLDLPTFLRRLREVGSGSLLSGPPALALMDEEQRKIFQRLQALMTVIEGHGNFIMDRVGARIIPSQPRIRSTLRAQSASAGPIARVIYRLLGLELKRRQYEDGQRFFLAIMEGAGPGTVGGCFESPESLPTHEEIEDPSLYLARRAV